MSKICLYCAQYHFAEVAKLPLGIRALAAYLIQQKMASEDEICIADNIKEAISFKADILGISAVSQVIQDANNFAKRVKEKFGCLTVLGGYYITNAPHKLPREFDIGVLGEGEETFAEIVALFQAGKLTAESLKKIKGICYRKNGEIIINEKRELIKDIDSLPWPYMGDIGKKRLKEIPIFTSRGCVYRCIFCDGPQFWDNCFRARSAKSVLTEIQYIVEHYRPKVIFFADDLWTSDKKRFKEIVDRLVELKIPEKVAFHGFVRSNLIHEEEIILLKKMNYTVVRFGAETGSEVLLRRLKGNNISVADHQRVVDLCQKYKISCSASFMFGIPGETKEDLEATIKFLRRNKGKLDISGLYPLIAIPGTEIWKWMRDRNIVSDDINTECYPRDFQRENFSWDHFLYFNQNNVPLEEFRKIIKNIEEEFITRTSKKRLLHTWLKRHLGKKFAKKIRNIYYSLFK